MTAYSYEQWNNISQDEQQRNPGISIPKTHALSNPDRGNYWTPQTAAAALSTHIQNTLTGPNRDDADRMFRLLKLEHRRAVEAPRTISNAMKRRQNDADRALEASGFSLTDEQADQLQSATDDVYRIQDQAEIMGLDPVGVANAMIDRAAAAAVGFRPARPDQARPEYAEYLNSEQGRQSQDNLNQSARQLYSMIREGSIDALDAAETVSDFGFTEDRTQGDERDFLSSVLKSMPLERNPLPIEPSQNFSVRMETMEEAKAMETVLKWAGEHRELPAREEVYEAFNSWKDNGLVESPFDPRPINRIGLIVGTGDRSSETAKDIIGGFGDTGEGIPTQIIVLTAENRNFEVGQEINGRPVVEGRAVAGPNGVRIDGLKEAPENAIVLMNLPQEQATDSVKRSIAANAFVGSSYQVAHVAADQMNPMEGQAIHLAGSMRKLSLAIDSNGQQVGNVIVGREPVWQTDEEGKTIKDKNGDPILKLDDDGNSITKPIYESGLSHLRAQGRQVDKDADPNRYFAAGHSRPRGGVTAVVFDGARNYDAAVRKYAKGKDPMGDGYSRIPKHAAILTTDNDKHACHKFLMENSGDRPILYAEATRKLSFAQDVQAGNDAQKVTVREAETELKIYDCPRSARNDPAMQEVQWNDPRMRGAIIMVSGNAIQGALNSKAQAVKVGQEALVDYAHSGIIFDDMQSDFHAANLTLLSQQMGKRFTAVNKEGEVVAMDQARDLTKKNAQSLSEVDQLTVSDRFRGSLSGLGVTREQAEKAEASRRNISYSLGDPVGQMTLAALPGMNPEKAARLAKLPLTLDEVRGTQDPDIKKALYENGMPSDTIKNLSDNKMWLHAVDRALVNSTEAENLEARFVGAGTSKQVSENSAAFIYGQDSGKPVMAFLGNMMPTQDGMGKEGVNPNEPIDRVQLREALQAAVRSGYAIGTTFDEGVGSAVIEEATKIPDAHVVVATSGNPKAMDPELRMKLGELLSNEKTQVIMPTAIAPYEYQNSDGVWGTRFADMRASMHDNIAAFSSVGVVVQASTSDPVLNVVDKMNKQDKPVAVMLPNDAEIASLDAYRGNVRMARGGGKMSVESVSLATAPSAQAYAEIVDMDTEVKLVDGVRRGNAGTFQSARLSRSDMARSGHHYKNVEWGSAARAVFSGSDVERLATDHKAGNLEPLGPYREVSARELEKRSLERNQLDAGVEKMFKDSQKQYASQIDRDVQSMNF